MIIIEYESQYLDQVLALARAMHAESVTHREMDFSEPRIRMLLTMHKHNPDFFIRLAVQGEEVLGFFFGRLVDTYYSEKRIAEDNAWFVVPRKRGSYAAVLLLGAFEQWVKKHGVNRVKLGQTTGVDIEKTSALFTRLGYRMTGINTVKEL